MTVAAESTALAASAPHLPEPVMRRGITESQWRTLFNLFPGGKPDSVLMVWDYCRSRQLDPMKKPCHIVEMDVKVNGQWTKRDVVMPGIYEYRITAQRTGLYVGHTEPEYGPEQEFAGVKAPAWCSMTVFRWNDKAGEKVPFPVKVWFAEVVATNRDGKANARWTKAPIQMLTKCTEAAGLREAFPEEIGGEQTVEEMEGRALVDEDVTPRAATIQPAQRKSAAAPAPPQAAAPVVDAEPVPAEPAKDPEPEPRKAPEGAPVHVGTIAVLKDLPSGGVGVTLNTGFVCGTRDQAIVAALRTFHEKGTVIDIETKAPKDPRFAPSIIDVTPIPDGEVVS